ncbi:hypothetical protein ACFQY7_06790 [Actinomadura luteofluorescens]
MTTRTARTTHHAVSDSGAKSWTPRRMWSGSNEPACQPSRNEPSVWVRP